MKDLNTLEMRLIPLTFGNIYLNVPGGYYQEYNRELIKLVEDIGQRFGTISGSKLKKGIHYIYQQIKGPSKRQIKLTLRNVPNSLIRKEDEFPYVYRCTKRYYKDILELIIQKLKASNSEMSNSDWLIPKVKKGIKYVSAEGTNDEIRTVATNLLNDIEYLDTLNYSRG